MTTILVTGIGSRLVVGKSKVLKTYPEVQRIFEVRKLIRILAFRR